MSFVRLLPAWLHAVADYAVGLSLIIVAVAVGGSGKAVATGVVVGAVVLVVSMLTKYPLGVAKVLPYVPSPDENADLHIDETDSAHREGWSVVVRGTLHHVFPDVAAFRERFDPDPWVTEGRDAWLIVDPFAITGRASGCSTRRIVRPSIFRASARGKANRSRGRISSRDTSTRRATSSC